MERRPQAPIGINPEPKSLDILGLVLQDCIVMIETGQFRAAKGCVDIKFLPQRKGCVG
jgi:hypothetical protein